jgi:nucleoid-associated protein YgaU
MRVRGVGVWLLVGVLGLAVAGCESLVVPPRVEDARVAVEAARSAGAATRAPAEFQAAERNLKQSQQLMTNRDTYSTVEAERLSRLALVSASSATVEAKLKADVEKVQAETQAAQAEAGRATAGLATAAEASRAAESRAQQAESRAQQAEARLARVEQDAAALKAQMTQMAQPVAPAITYARYVVRRGDTLKKIAARPEVYGDAGQWQRIYEANREILGKKMLPKTGQVLLIQKP